MDPKFEKQIETCGNNGYIERIGPKWFNQYFKKSKLVNQNK